jgi:hypothetical protein
MMSQSIEDRHPHLARWVKEYGYVEIGHNDWTPSFIRALDIGGAFWEGANRYATLDEALCALDEGCAQLMREVIGEQE